MLYLILAVFAFVLGGVCVYFLGDKKRKAVEAQQLSNQELFAKQREQTAATEAKHKDFLKREASFKEDLANAYFELEQRRVTATQQEASLQSARTELQTERFRFESEKSRKEELIEAYRLARQELSRSMIHNRKLAQDVRDTKQQQTILGKRADELAARYLADVEKWLAKTISSNNYTSCRQKLTDVIEWCREIGANVPKAEEDRLLTKLKADFEEEVRIALQKEEQARIKAEIREQQAREREIEKELQQLERERAAVQAALAKALRDAGNQHNEEVQRLQARLAEAEARGVRAKAMAELTKAGNIYVISNIGTMGEGVYKVGMTRRLEPLDRVSELGDASVPFPFDVHLMIACDDAPKLENALHKALQKHRVNRVNLRKEYFRVDLDRIVDLVKQQHGEVVYKADPEALEYRQSLTMSDDDERVIEEAFERAEKQTGVREHIDD